MGRGGGFNLSSSMSMARWLVAGGELGYLGRRKVLIFL
jgi:hypothetical protein